MKKIGIICEYNPFHNGHIYHINKIKKLFPNDMIILVMSTYFTERGEISLLNKWDKTEIALNHGIDLVLELPTYFSTNTADIFSQGAIKILSYFNVDYLVFGSECNDINFLNKLVDTQCDENYDRIVKNYIDEGYNYPTSMSKALKELCGDTITTPNDLLGLSYIKQIRLQESSIEPITIKRTNDYHEESLQDTITSATSIRTAITNNTDISSYVPSDTLKYLPTTYDYQNNLFILLKYKLISEIDELDRYLDISEGLDKRIKKYVFNSNNYAELVNSVKTKRYTYNRINRMFIHILLNLTKDKAMILKDINYIKVLGFNRLGKLYLKEIKKEGLIPIITNYSQLEDPSLNYELQVSFIYNQIMNKEMDNLRELKSIPIQKE